MQTHVSCTFERHYNWVRVMLTIEFAAVTDDEPQAVIVLPYSSSS